MIKNFDIAYSIQWQLEQIRTQFGKALSGLEAPKKGIIAKELVELADAFACVRPYQAIGNIACICFLLEKKYEKSALLMQCYSLLAMGSDARAVYMKANEDSSPMRLSEFYEYYKAVIENFWQEPDEEEDLSPDGRYATDENGVLTALQPKQCGENLRRAKTLMSLDNHAAAAECLFRAKHALAAGQPPSHLIDHPKIKDTASAANCLECWLRARAETDQDRKKVLAWTAFYWLVNHHLNRNGSRMTPAIDVTFWPFEILAEFELLGERQEEFLACHHQMALGASQLLCDRLIEENRCVQRLTDLHGPTLEELADVAREIPEKKSDKDSGQDPSKKIVVDDWYGLVIDFSESEKKDVD